MLRGRCHWASAGSGAPSLIGALERTLNIEKTRWADVSSRWSWYFVLGSEACSGPALGAEGS